MQMTPGTKVMGLLQTGTRADPLHHLLVPAWHTACTGHGRRISTTRIAPGACVLFGAVISWGQRNLMLDAGYLRGANKLLSANHSLARQECTSVWDVSEHNPRGEAIQWEGSKGHPSCPVTSGPSGDRTHRTFYSPLGQGEHDLE